MHKIYLITLFFSSNVFAELYFQNDFLGQYKGTHNIENSNAIPSNFGQTEFRSDLKFKSELIDFRLRSSFISKIDSDKKYLRSEGIASEVYLNHIYQDIHYLAFGKINSQWGPSEFISWSNPFVHFNSKNKSFFYNESGQYVLKYDYTPTNKFSTSILYKYHSENLNSNNDSFTYSEKFRPEFLLRTEYTFDNNIDYFGGTISKTNNDIFNLGIYGKYSFNDVFSFYTDSAFKYSSKYYSLKYVNNSGYSFLSFEDQQTSVNKINAYLNLGFRYEGRTDFRFEYILNPNGFSNEDFKNINNNLFRNNPYAFRNLSIFKARGSELLGKQYLYQSLRIPDLGPSSKLIAFFRNTFSLQDHTTNFQVSIDYAFNNQTVIYLENQFFIGKRDSEFNGEGRWSIVFGPKYSF